MAASQVGSSTENLSAVQEMQGDTDSIPSQEKSLEGKRPAILMFFCLGNPWAWEPGRLYTVPGGQGVGHDWVTKAHWLN